MTQCLTNSTSIHEDECLISTSIHEDECLIPGLAQWIKDLALLWLWCRSKTWLRSCIVVAMVSQRL